MSSSAYINNRNKDTLILGEGPTPGIDSTIWTTEAKTSINFTQSNRKFCLSLHYHGSNSFLFVNGTKIDQFKEIIEIKKYPLSLRNISKYFASINTKKIGLNRYAYEFFGDYNKILFAIIKKSLLYY